MPQTEGVSQRTFTNSYRYDWYGRLQSRTYPTGFQTGYAYNSAGHLEKITGAGRTLWQCNAVNDLGQVTLGVDSTLSLNFTYGLNNQRVKTVQQRYGNFERML